MTEPSDDISSVELPTVVIEPFDDTNPEHARLLTPGDACLNVNTDNVSTADLSEVSNGS